MKIVTSVGKFIAVAAVAFCVGYFCARYYVAPPASSADCAAWAGAFGTVAAFFGTVWIATSAERKVIKQEHARAVVAAASILPSIESMSGAIELAELMLGNENIKVVGDFSSSLLRILSAPVPWTNEDIVPLLAIPGNVATSLARAGPRIN